MPPFGMLSREYSFMRDSSPSRHGLGSSGYESSHRKEVPAEEKGDYFWGKLAALTQNSSWQVQQFITKPEIIESDN